MTNFNFTAMKARKNGNLVQNDSTQYVHPVRMIGEELVECEIWGVVRGLDKNTGLPIEGKTQFCPQANRMYVRVPLDVFGVSREELFPAEGNKVSKNGKTYRVATYGNRFQLDNVKVMAEETFAAKTGKKNGDYDEYAAKAITYLDAMKSQKVGAGK